MTTIEPFTVTVVIYVGDFQLRRKVEMVVEALGFACDVVDADSEIRRRFPSRSFLIADESFFDCVTTDSAVCDRNSVGRLETKTGFEPRRVMLHLVQNGNVVGALRAIRSGACNVLERPVDDQDLINNIRAAADLEATLAKRQLMAARSHWQIDSLSLTEAAIFNGLVEGRTNKEISRDLNISLRTVEAERAQIMVKLNVTTLAQLIAFVTSERIRSALEPLSEFDRILSKHGH